MAVREYKLSVVIPTFNRGQVLLQTLQYLFRQTTSPQQIIVVDQTDYAVDDKVFQQLTELAKENKVTWLRLAKPSIPCAMNQGLLKATSSHVLFIDDDVKLQETFIEEHLNALITHDLPAQVGQIIQPWQTAEDKVHDQTDKALKQDFDFAFNSTQPAEIVNCMAGNLCVNRELAIQAGGFDERFSGSAYRFETEFCRRMCRVHSQPFAFAPNASLVHLHVTNGGTRSIASHLTSCSPSHSMGDYYFALREGQGMQRLGYMAQRYFASIVAKFYVLKPWWIIVRLIAETRGLLQAYVAYRRGPLYIKNTPHTEGVVGDIV